MKIYYKLLTYNMINRERLTLTLNKIDAWLITICITVLGINILKVLDNFIV